MKIILVLLDGLGDRSYEILNHRTPLEAAATPNLNRLACLGSNGLFHPALPGQCLPSELAHYLLFGYGPENFPGRGLLEAVGDGVTFVDEDVLCLAHFAEVNWQDGKPILINGRDDIKGDAQEIGRMFEAVSPYKSSGIGFRLHQTRRNDAILILSGGASPYVSDSDPMITGRTIGQICPLLNNPEPEKAERTAKALNEYLTYSYGVLTGHKINHSLRERNPAAANFLVTQRCGRRIVQELFSQHWGLTGMLIASGSIYCGLAHELGMNFIRVKDSPDAGKDLRERINIALADSNHGFIHVHTKIPDEAAHTGGPEQKAEMITALDCGLDKLVKAVETRDDLLVVVTADHSTPSESTLIHSGEPVPLIMAGRSVRRDRVCFFDEVSAAAGCLGLLRGRELMLTILNCADRSVLMGHRMGKTERPYVSYTYEPFKLTR